MPFLKGGYNNPFAAGQWTVPSAALMQSFGMMPNFSITARWVATWSPSCQHSPLQRKHLGEIDDFLKSVTFTFAIVISFPFCLPLEGLYANYLIHLYYTTKLHKKQNEKITFDFSSKT